MNHFISLQEAINLTTRYRNRKEQLYVPMYQNKNISPISETFSRAAIDTLLAQDGCTGLRIYYGMTENDEIHAILVGVDASNLDLLPVADLSGEPLATTEDEGTIVELGIRCPTNCAAPSPLNP